MELKDFEVMLDTTLGEKMPGLVENILKPFKESSDNKMKQLFEETTSGKGAVKKEIFLKTGKLFSAILRNDYGEAKALSEGTAADGGYLVHPEYVDELQRLIPMYGIMRRECRIWPMKSNTLVVPSMGVNGGLTAYIIGEGAVKTASKWTLASITLTARKFCCFAVGWDELLEDAGIDVMTLLAVLMAEALGGLEDTTGFATLLAAAGVNTVTLTGTTFASLGTPDGISKLLDMQTALPQGARNGKYYMHAQVFAYLQKIQANTYDATHYGSFIYGAPGGPIPATLWGKPIELTDDMPGAADTAVNTKFVLFGDLKRAAAFGDRKTMTIDKSTEATVVDEASATIHLFQQDASAIRAVERVDIKAFVPQALSVLKTAAS